MVRKKLTNYPLFLRQLADANRSKMGISILHRWRISQNVTRMKTFEIKRVADALIRTVFMFGMFHVGVLVLYGFLSGSFEGLNAFAVLDLPLFFPAISQGVGSFLFSYGCFFMVYGMVYMVFTKPRSK